MSNVLIVAEYAEGQVKRTTYSAVTFAKQAAAALGGSYSILVLGSGLDDAAAQLGKLGAEKVLVADDAKLDKYLAENFAPTVAAVAKDYAVVCGTASAFGKDLLARVAGRLDAGYAADITAVLHEDGGLLYQRPIFAGNAFGICKINSAVQIVSVRQSAFSATEPAAGASVVEKVDVVAAGSGVERLEWVSFDQVKSERPDLADAKVVVAGGRGMKDKFHELLDPLADVFGAGIGASRAACDAGYCAADIQVGQTGKIVASQLYFAIGISGAIQHVAGMKSSKVIVAINKDEEAPIFQVADYGLVADLFKVLPELTEKLKAAKQ